MSEDKLPTLRELRKERCMEVNDLASLLGVRENTVYFWERGQSTPPLRHALQIARILKTTVEQINWFPNAGTA